MISAFWAPAAQRSRPFGKEYSDLELFDQAWRDLCGLEEKFESNERLGSGRDDEIDNAAGRRTRCTSHAACMLCFPKEKGSSVFLDLRMVDAGWLKG